MRQTESIFLLAEGCLHWLLTAWKDSLRRGCSYQSVLPCFSKTASHFQASFFLRSPTRPGFKRKQWRKSSLRIITPPLRREPTPGTSGGQALVRLSCFPWLHVGTNAMLQTSMSMEPDISGFSSRPNLPSKRTISLVTSNSISTTGGYPCPGFTGIQGLATPTLPNSVAHVLRDRIRSFWNYSNNMLIYSVGLRLASQNVSRGKRRNRDLRLERARASERSDCARCPSPAGSRSSSSAAWWTSASTGPWVRTGRTGGKRCWRPPGRWSASQQLWGFIRPWCPN